MIDENSGIPKEVKKFQETGECQPKTMVHKGDKCNICICTTGGKSYKCSTFKCDPVQSMISANFDAKPFQSLRRCPEESWFRYGCLFCECSQRNSPECVNTCHKPKSQKLTKRMAYPGDVADSDRKPCKPGTFFKRKCNNCHCDMKSNEICTRRLCRGDNTGRDFYVLNLIYNELYRYDLSPFV